jgi:hypothetical protein
MKVLFKKSLYFYVLFNELLHKILLGRQNQGWKAAQFGGMRRS